MEEEKQAILDVLRNERYQGIERVEPILRGIIDKRFKAGRLTEDQYDELNNFIDEELQKQYNEVIEDKIEEKQDDNNAKQFNETDKELTEKFNEMLNSKKRIEENIERLQVTKREIEIKTQEEIEKLKQVQREERELRKQLGILEVKSIYKGKMGIIAPSRKEKEANDTNDSNDEEER